MKIIYNEGHRQTISYTTKGPPTRRLAYRRLHRPYSRGSLGGHSVSLGLSRASMTAQAAHPVHQDSPESLQGGPRWPPDGPKGRQHAPRGLQEPCQETSYTRNVTDKDDHIQELNIEELSYTRTTSIIYKDQVSYTRLSKTTPKICLIAALSTSHFSEDVSGETAVFEVPKIRPAISISPFSEDVSGETLIFSIRRLKTRPPTSRFGEDVSGETLVLGTFPDMNGKRVKGQSCARTCSIITIKCNVGELSELPQGIPMDTRSPNVHKESPDYPPHFSVRLQCRPSIPHLSDAFEGPSEGTRTHAQEEEAMVRFRRPPQKHL